MYIERVPNRNSTPAILLRESYREAGKVRKRTLANLSNWPPTVVEELEQILKGGRTIARLEETFEVVRSLPHGHVCAVLGTLRRLELDQVISQRASVKRTLVVAMVVARILEPVSKLATLRQLTPETATHTLSQELGLSEIHKDSLYQALDWLLQRQERIEQQLAARHLKPGMLVLVDLSSTYLEGEHCHLAEYGYSRDQKRGKLQVVFGLMCDHRGCPVAVEVFAGNTSDPNTLKHHLEKLKGRFGLSEMVVVGDRGMLPDKQIKTHLKPLEGWGWITALRSESIEKLLKENAFDLEKLHQEEWIEFSSERYDNERLVACYNTALAKKRNQRRQELLVKTEQELDQVWQATQRKNKPLAGRGEIGLSIGKVLNRFKMAKHFQLEIVDHGFTYERNLSAIAAESKLDGIYVIRTNVTAQRLKTQEILQAYKSLSQVEQAFRCLKLVDLNIRPIFHRLENRVRAHVLLCFLAYYVEWHMRQSLAPILFAEDDWPAAQLKRASPVQPAKKSDSAQHKAATQRNSQDLPVHSFRSLLADLATLCRLTIQPRQSMPCFEKVVQPTALQKQAFQLLKLSL